MLSILVMLAVPRKAVMAPTLIAEMEHRVNCVNVCPSGVLVATADSRLCVVGKEGGSPVVSPLHPPADTQFIARLPDGRTLALSSGRILLASPNLSKFNVAYTC